MGLCNLGLRVLQGQRISSRVQGMIAFGALAQLRCRTIWILSIVCIAFEHVGGD